jgi:hypothetical protein
LNTKNDVSTDSGQLHDQLPLIPETETVHRDFQDAQQKRALITCLALLILVRWLQQRQPARTADIRLEELQDPGRQLTCPWQSSGLLSNDLLQNLLVQRQIGHDAPKSAILVREQSNF